MGKSTPIVTLGVAQRSRQGSDLWGLMQAQFDTHPGLKKPSELWMAVVIHPLLSEFLEATHWLKDFESSIAGTWITRDPKLAALSGGTSAIRKNT